MFMAKLFSNHTFYYAFRCFMFFLTTSIIENITVKFGCETDKFLHLVS